MSTVGELEAQKRELKSDLDFDKRLIDKMSKVKDKIDGIDCKEIVKKCRVRRELAKKYKQKYTSKKSEVNKMIKEINAKIKSLTRKRCPNGYRKNRKTSKCNKK